jgi:hypothetical protein
MNMAGGIRAGALNVCEIARRPSQKTFRDVAATGIAGAKNQDGWFHGVKKHSTFNIKPPGKTHSRHGALDAGSHDYEVEFSMLSVEC